MAIVARENCPVPVDAGERRQPLRWTDCLLIGLFCLALFGYAMVSGRPLTLHEARLPQVSREMKTNGDWLIPRSGGRPWLERPPLPHWVTVATSTALGQNCDRVWVVRLPATLAGCAVCILVAWMASVWYGRWIGLSSGLLLATMFEFYTYATLAEDDIFLAVLVTAAMALFVRMEFASGDRDQRVGLLNGRPWTMVAFFIVLGLTNLAKGPLVGAAEVGGAVAVFLLCNRDWRRVRHYVWLWGWAMFLALTLFWPIAVYMRYPEVLQNWLYDYAGGTDQYNQPVWYYLVTLLGALAPWTPAALLGLWLTAGKSRQRNSAERFLWCWAVVPLLILSIPSRKHHHYLVPNVAPWAVLSALALVEVARSMFKGPAWSRQPAFGLAVFGLPGALALWLFHSKIPGPGPVTAMLAAVWLACVFFFYWGLSRQSGRWVLGAFLAGLGVAYCWGQTFLCASDRTLQDTAFLQRVEKLVPRDRPLMVNANLGSMDFFRISFYLRSDAVLLHNLTFLRDQTIHADEVYVITRFRDQAKLETLGTVEMVLRSERTRDEKDAFNGPPPAGRFTLFKLRFRPDLQRYPAPTAISTMQAMERKQGPYCGPPL